MTQAAMGYVCPLCKGDLITSAEAYRCASCDRRYPIVWGIPDFRVFPDPYIGIEEDHQKGLKLAARYDQSDARGLMEFYWSITPDTPAELAQRYMRHDLAGEVRGREMLRGLKTPSPALPRSTGRGGATGGMTGGKTSLELGCRTGGILAAMAEGGGKVVGIDIAFRWLVVAKKRLQERGHSAQLVCCCAQHLPFMADQFDLVIGGNVVEHSREQGRIFAEANRVMSPGGMFHTVTVNRYSLAREPHVGVWGVGFLPRRWMDRYVRWRRGVGYEHVRLVSAVELRRMIRRGGFAAWRIDPPAIGAGEVEGLSRCARGIVGVYNLVRRWVGVRQMLLAFGPLLEGTCSGKKDHGPGARGTVEEAES